MASASHVETAESIKEPRDARRRRELIEATITSIARHGLSRTTIAKVAKIAGLSTGIVNFYFHSKQALLLATLEHVDREFERRQQEALERAGEDPVQLLEAMIEVDFDPEVCEPGRIAVWAAFWGESSGRADYMRVCGARGAAMEQRVVKLFEKIASSGKYPHLDHAALGRAFYHLLSSLPETMLQGDVPFDFEGAKATLRGFLASVFPAEFSAFGPHTSVLNAYSSTNRDPEPEFETLPPWVYHDPEFYDLEVEHIFRRHWLLAGHTSQAPNTGDYMTLDVAGERALVIRDGAGELRAFHNVCRHRASRVVAGATGSCRGSMVCPYHGWAYGYDGRLQSVPSDQDLDRLDKSRLSLPAVEIEEWMGFVFVRFGGDGPSVAASLEPLAEVAEHFRFAEMKPWGSRVSLGCDFNWKMFSEDESEGYYIPTALSAMGRLFGDTHTPSEPSTTDARPFAVLQQQESPLWCERAYQRLLPRVPHLREEYQRAWTYYGIFPTTVFLLTPDLVGTYQVLPDGPGRCTIQRFAVALEDDRREMRAARYLNRRISRNIIKEDLEFCAWTDAGVRSSSYQGGVLSGQDSGVWKFHERIRQLIPVAAQPDPPPTGRVAAVNEKVRRNG
jgi:phenylpropionate dioxygenase-like ring-hydroxylating dioxygenase large terminal subunit/AcrR family transcriptional regulator